MLLNTSIEFYLSLDVAKFSSWHSSFILALIRDSVKLKVDKSNLSFRELNLS